MNTILDNDTIKDCLQYSEEPERLEELLKDVSVSYDLVGYRKFFDDEVKRQVINVEIKRGDKSISFEFGLSLVDSEAFIMPQDPRGYKDFGNLLISFDGVPAHMKKDFIAHGHAEVLEGIYKGQKGTFYSYHGHGIGGLGQVRINKLKKVKKGLLYSILACVRSDYYCPSIFEDFCVEFGYDEDSRKAHDTWQGALKQSQKIQSIFTEDEINCLPS